MSFIGLPLYSINLYYLINNFLGLTNCMNIGFDAKRAVCNNTGLGNYSRLVIDLLSEFFPMHKYSLYAPKNKENPRLSSLLERNNVEIVAPKDGCDKIFSTLWRVKGICNDLKRDKVDLFHGLSNELPINIQGSGIPSIVTIHDLIFLRYPEYYEPIDRKIYNYKFRKACENANRVIAITECTKRDIITYYGIDASKIDVVYQGCADIFANSWSQNELEKVRIKYSLPQNFILSVGTIEKRKNALLIVKALARMRSDIHLVMIGKPTTYYEDIKEFAVENHLSARIHIYQDLPFNYLPAFYRLSKLFVYPSRFEGFGIPMLEAITCGVPAIGATGSCLEEAAGEGALYVDPDDVDGMAESINRVLEDEDLRTQMIAKGLEYAKTFSRKEIASNIMNVYRKTLNI